MLTLEIFSLVVDILVVTRDFPSRGRLLRVTLLREDFHLFFHHDEVRCLVKSVLDCSRFFKGYPLPEFRPVPESFPQSVDCHFVAVSTEIVDLIRISSSLASLSALAAVDLLGHAQHNQYERVKSKIIGHESCRYVRLSSHLSSNLVESQFDSKNGKMPKLL
ncbi:hypothetical protein DY000_02022280 [Brassica cretica]|uniref:Uncharacterized protein n=1 Tax=Brassica cretica TaxID=69181 RepID=A0ABQ7EJX3_BRACR|nr:hypothetical protein DY000_02022280 [Brassica cretica]